MLIIFYNLKHFIENNYLELGIREYSRLLNITPPTASKLLKYYQSEGLLKKKEERKYILFRANRDSNVLKDLSRIYWKQTFFELIEHIKQEYFTTGIILFGSLSKLENKEDSDIDLAIFTDSNKEIDFSKYEIMYNRKIQIFLFKSINQIQSKELKMNILNGYLLDGAVK